MRGDCKLVKLHPSFLIVLILFIALGYTEQFFIILLVVTLHELSHLLVAVILGAKVEKIIITPIGQVGIIKDIDYLNIKKRLLIIIAGPLSNVILFLIFNYGYPNNFIFFRQVNLAILLFNILPIYPLDGGRICQIILSNTIGVINGYKALSLISKVINIVLFLLGIIQVILYPFNISLIILSIYLHKINEKEYMYMTFNFYKNIIKKADKIKLKNHLPLKCIVMDKSNTINTVINKLCWDNFHIIYISDGKNIIKSINEFEIVEYATTNGLNRKIEDIFIS